MRGDEAKVLLGLPPDSRPNTSQVKEAYKKKVWESHPDLFPAHEKLQAESRFKLISEAYGCLLTGTGRGQGFASGKCLDKVAPCFFSNFPFYFQSSFISCSPTVQFSARYSHVVRTGVPRTNGGRTNHKLIGIPFLFIILGTIGLGGLNATRAYRKQKDAYPSHNPFLP